MPTSHITIHSTKKLAAKIPDAFFAAQPEQATNVVYLNTSASNNPLSDWHANLLLLQRRQCVLMVHDKTRFPLFIPNFRKADFAKFEFYFRDAFMNTLLKLDASEQQLDNAAQLLTPLRFDTVCDRSVQGTMNRMAGDIEYMLQYEGLPIADISSYRTCAWLADRPCTVKGQKDCIWPKKAMLNLLGFC